MASTTPIITTDFFNDDALIVAKKCLGKVLWHLVDGIWLGAQIIETEAYYLNDKASHASLGYTEKRKALFMPPGTIYMYYARGADSFNISCQGEGNAVLIKSAIAYIDHCNQQKMVKKMQQLNPIKGTNKIRPLEKLCSGQTILCRSLQLKVSDWDQKTFDPNKLTLHDIGYQPANIIQTTRLGIPKGRDEQLPYRFIDQQFVNRSTSPATAKKDSSHFNI